MHLSAFLDLPGDALQWVLAVRADHWAMVYHLIRIADLHQGASRMSSLPSCLLLAPLTLTPPLSPEPITRWGFAAVVAIFDHLSFHPLQPFCQLGDLLIGLG
jgi:hypothetical protein